MIEMVVNIASKQIQMRHRQRNEWKLSFKITYKAIKACQFHAEGFIRFCHLRQNLVLSLPERLHIYGKDKGYTTMLINQSLIGLHVFYFYNISQRQYERVYLANTVTNNGHPMQKSVLILPKKTPTNSLTLDRWNPSLGRIGTTNPDPGAHNNRDVFRLRHHVPHLHVDLGSI